MIKLCSYSIVSGKQPVSHIVQRLSQSPFMAMELPCLAIKNKNMQILIPHVSSGVKIICDAIFHSALSQERWLWFEGHGKLISLQVAL